MTPTTTLPSPKDLKKFQLLMLNEENPLLNMTDLWYGMGGKGKSQALVALIKAVHEQTGQVGRIYIGDGSSVSYQGLVMSGKAEVFQYTSHHRPLETVRLMSKGYWPKDVKDPQSPLLAPTKDDLARIGVWGFEGYGVMSQYFMGNIDGGLADRSAKGEKIGQDSPIMIKDGGEVIGGNPISHYNVAQNEMLGALRRTSGLPGHFRIWTSHERGVEAKDNKMTGEAVIGPEGPGAKQTPLLSREFNNTLHFVTASKKKQAPDGFSQKQVSTVEKDYRIYTTEHFDPDAMVMQKYIAGTRVQGLKPYYAAEEMGANIIEFYNEFFERLKANS